MDEHYHDHTDTGLWPTDCPHGCAVNAGETCEHGYPAQEH